MRTFYNTAQLALLTISSAVASSTNWKVNVGKGHNSMPFARSDLSATLVDDWIYLMGGCDHPDGNVATETGNGEFWCPSITNRNIAYSPLKDEFIVLKEMPKRRFRHTAVAVNGRVWVIGGLYETYEIAKEVDVYDTATDSWQTVGYLDEATTDLASFQNEGKIYVAGGYKEMGIRKDATNQLFSFPTGNVLMLGPSAEKKIEVFQEKPLTEARGDIHAASYGPFTYIAGGFSTNDDSCEALNSVEVFDFDNGASGLVRPMNYGRGDKGLVAMHGWLFAIGGENKEKCDGAMPVSTVVDDVEILDADDPLMASWMTIGSIESDKFRFQAVAYPRLNKMYTFGGQYFYNEACECYRTSADVMHYEYVNVDKGFYSSEDEGLSNGAVAGITFGVLLGVGAIGMYVWRKMCMHKNVSGNNATEEVVEMHGGKELGLDLSVETGTEGDKEIL